MTDRIIKLYITGDLIGEDFVTGLEIGGADVKFTRQTYDHQKDAEQLEYRVVAPDIDEGEQ